MLIVLLEYIFAQYCLGDCFIRVYANLYSILFYSILALQWPALSTLLSTWFWKVLGRGSALLYIHLREAFWI